MKLLIGFDMQNSRIRLLLADKGAAAAQSASLRYTSRLFSEEFFKEAARLLEEYFEGVPSARHLSAYVSLPSAAVGLETFSLPNLSRSRANVALDTELKNLYEGSLKNKKVNKFLLAQFKDHSVYGAVYFDKTLVARLYKLLTESKVLPRLTTYAGNAVLDSALGLSMRLRGKNFLFADVQQESTTVTLCSRGRTMGTALLPHGTNILRGDEVLSEYMITDHDAAEIAVINAREAARAKTLTLSAQAAEESVQADAEEEDFSEEGGLKAVEEEGGAGSPEGGDKPGASKVKIYKKTPKRYPKFMTRETPQTEEGICYENFRILLKWFLLYARQADTAEYMAKPEFIVVHLPQQYSYLLDRANEEQRECGGLLLRPFAVAEKLSAPVRENLDLYGCIFAKHFNRNHNF